MNGPHARNGTRSRWKWIAPSDLGDQNARSEPRPARHVRIRLRAVMSHHLPAQRPRHVRKGPTVMNRHRVMIPRRGQIHRPNVLSLSHNGPSRRPNVRIRSRSVLNPRPTALSRRSVQILRRVQNHRHQSVRGHRLPTEGASSDKPCAKRSRVQRLPAFSGNSVSWN